MLHLNPLTVLDYEEILIKVFVVTLNYTHSVTF